jgi:RNA-directed DNA polymerase
MNSWHDIDWQHCYNFIAKKQEVLVVAHQKGERQFVRKLQRDIVTSFEGRALAIRRVSTNKGKNTPGIDERLWKNPNDKWNAIQELLEIVKNPYSYKASPVKRVWIPKSDGSQRPLGIPTLIDRGVQALYQLALDPVAEVDSDIHSYGFRKYRSAHHAIARVRTLLDKSYSPEWILDADIEKCYPRICHKFLMKHVQLCDKVILYQWLKAGIMEKDMFEKSEMGTPQGSIISPNLANITLNGIEKAMQFDNNGKRRKKVHLVRYADDFIVTGTSHDELRGEIMESGSKFLEERGLRYKEAKTKISHITEGFDFLGFSIRRIPRDLRRNKRNENQGTTLVIRPQKKKAQIFKNKIKYVINTQAPIGDLLRTSTP